MENKEMNEKLSAAASEAVVAQMTGKKWYLSKTFWANVIAGVAVGAQMKFGFVLTPEIQMLVLAGLNVALRKITKEPVVW